MKKVSLDTWIQLFGMVGLLGGLIFVGLEMRQSQIIALGAQQHARRAETIGEVSTANANHHAALGGGGPAPHKHPEALHQQAGHSLHLSKKPT